MYQLFVYVPISHLEEVKKAIFEAGAGQYQNYSHCCWTTQGVGQFTPLSGANPFLGITNKEEYVSEIKIETICNEKIMKEVLKRMIEAHPYEEPAYGVLPFKTLKDF